MLKKLLLTLMITAVSLFAMNFQTASKDELMSIKGIGEKRASAIMKYRRSHKIKSAADLKNVDGIGDEIADNAKRGIKNADKKVSHAKKSTRAKSTSKKKTSVKDKVSKKTKATKEKASKKAKSSKSKATKRVKKKAGDTTKRAEKKAKSKAKSKAKKAAKKKLKK